MYIERGRKKFIDFSFDLISETMLLISVLRSSSAEAYIKVSMPSILTSLEGVQSHLFEAEFPTSEVY